MNQSTTATAQVSDQKLSPITREGDNLRHGNLPTYKAFALAMVERENEVKQGVKRLQFLANTIRANTPEDMREFFKTPKTATVAVIDGKERTLHPAVEAMLDEGSTYRSAYERYRESRAIFKASLAGMSLVDDDGNVLTGWHQAVEDASRTLQSSKANKAAKQADAEKNEIAGAMLRANPDANRDAILASVDKLIANTAEETKREKKRAAAGRAATKAGGYFMPGDMSADETYAWLIKTIGKKAFAAVVKASTKAKPEESEPTAQPAMVATTESETAHQ